MQGIYEMRAKPNMKLKQVVNFPPPNKQERKNKRQRYKRGKNSVY